MLRTDRVALPLAATDQPAAGDASPTALKFLRLERDAEDHPLSLQTAVIHYVPADGDSKGPTVDLIGAVHIGEKSYYEALNKQFEQYDVFCTNSSLRRAPASKRGPSPAIIPSPCYRGA